MLQLRIDNDHTLQYYLPYLFKSDLLTFADSPKLKSTDYNLYSKEGCGLNCEYCDKQIKSHCKLCKIGFYLQQGDCVAICNFPLIADNFRLKCVKPNTQDAIYFQVYSKSSCKNNYGRILTDCSCAPSCKQSGNCCHDFEENKLYKVIEGSNLSDRLHKKCKKNENCEYCDSEYFIENEILYCNQCNVGYNFFEGKCFRECPNNYIRVGNECLKPDNCISLIDNCLECNSNQCKKCAPGTYNYNGSCILECPEKYKGDRVTWSCLDLTVFTWHWILPSNYSCKNGCTSSDSYNCSCSKDCVQKGNCCQDYEAFCFATKEIKSSLRSNLLKKLGRP